MKYAPIAIGFCIFLIATDPGNTGTAANEAFQVVASFFEGTVTFLQALLGGQS